MKVYLANISLLAILLFSCEKEVDIDMGKQDPRLVIYGFLNPDSSFAVHVSKSHFVLERAALENLTDARVAVYEGERKLGDLEHQKDGYYRLEGVYPEPGKQYTLKAAREGLESVSATETALSKVEVLQLKVEKFTGDRESEVKFSYTFKLEDPAGERNIYFFKAFQIVKDATDRIHMWHIPLESPDPSLEKVNYSMDLALKETFFDGQTYEIQLSDKVFRNKNNGDAYRESYLAVRQISETAYLYLKSVDKYNAVKNDFFSEPIRIYSNVEGGYGIWLSTSENRIGID
jgi:hypothetical protein